jgi:hypothetical protein
VKIENGAALAGWLAGIQGPGGEPLTRDQAAELLGLSRATMFATLAVGDTAASPESKRGKIRPQVLATIDALETLRRVSPAEFAALVARRCSPAGQAGRPSKN